MHIAHAVFTKYKGGLEQAYINDTKALVDRGNNVICLLHENAPYLSEARVIANDTACFRPRGFYDFFTAYKIRKALKKYRPDIIVAHNGRAIQIMRYASLGLNIPLIGVSHSYKTARAFSCDALIVLSEHMRKHFVKAGYPENKIKIIPNLLNLSKEPVQEKFRSPAVIGAVGRFTAEKGFQDFLPAIAELKKLGAKFVVKIAGSGPQFDELKAQAIELGIADIVEWLGWIEDKEAFYQGIDILCLPSREDSFPMVILETLAHKVPIVATDVPGAISMLINGADGLIVEKQNPKAIAEALKRFIDNPAFGYECANAGWQTIQAYNFPAIADLWQKTLSEFIGQARK